jgi:hypothetical protein
LNFTRQLFMQKEDLLTDEVLIIEESGEMPEVAYHGAIYYLTKDTDGPRLSLEQQDHLPLKKAVIQRYQTIMVRDLTPDNRTKSLYRGLERCICNWQRLKLFSSKENLDISHIRQKMATALVAFLNQESDDVGSGKYESCVNCSQTDLEEFILDLGLDPGKLSCSLKLCKI